jgi:hypothetical protein
MVSITIMIWKVVKEELAGVGKKSSILITHNLKKIPFKQ